jgi:hypothetical protein
MKPQLAFACIIFGVNSFFTQTLFAAQVLVVASNGKWDMEYEDYGNVNALAAKALAACRAKGGTDPKIVWSLSSNVMASHARIAHGAIAISDHGTGTIVGWSFEPNFRNWPRAKDDCRRKGGRNPKVVAHF